jgi:hypothetical protein
MDKANKIYTKVDFWLLERWLLQPMCSDSHIGLQIKVCPEIHSKGNLSHGVVLKKKIALYKVIN